MLTKDKHQIDHASTVIDSLSNRADYLFANQSILFAYIYGSFADGSYHKFSDLDVAVYVDESVSPDLYLDLELALALEIDAMLGHRIQSEVRIINNLPLAIKGKIVTEGSLMYCMSDEIRINFETNVRKAYFDFIPVLDHFRHLYRESALCR